MTNSWDRIKERKELFLHFEHDRNIAMFAPRRLGKSWLMKNLLLQEAIDKGWSAVYCDLQADNSYQKAVLTLVEKLQAQDDIQDSLLTIAKAKFEGILKGQVTSFKDILSQTEPEALLDVILSHLSQQQKPTLILLDEVTICASNIMKIVPSECFLLLNTLRKMRDAYPNIRWMLTGSIGIDHFSKHHQLAGAFNNLHPFLIEPFNAQIATDFVNYFCQGKVMESFTLDKSAHQHLQNRLGWLSPFYLENLCLQIKPTHKNNPTISKEDINLACDKLLQHPHNQVFSGWPDHIERNIPDDMRPTCKTLLKILCQHNDGENVDTLRMQCEPEYTEEQIKEALTILQNDSFIQQDPASTKYKFAMHLLADYWQEYQ
jgi:hypothetical protein